MDQLKIYKCLGEPKELAGLGDWDRNIVKVQDSRERLDGDTEFLVLWGDDKGEPRTWVPTGVLYAMGGERFLEDFFNNKLP